MNDNKSLITDSDPQVVRMSTYGIARLAATGSSEGTECLSTLLSSKQGNPVKAAVLESVRATGVKAPALLPGVSALLSPNTDPQLAMSALGVIRSFGPEVVKSVQSRLHDLEVGTSNKEVAAAARTMLQGVTQ